MITGLYAGLLGLLLVYLIFRVAKRRLKYRVGLGDGGIPDLNQAIRVHGNFAETVPIILIIMLIMELSLSPPWLVHGFGVLLVTARIAHAQGISSSPNHSLGRKIGIGLTLTLIIAGSFILISKALFNL